MPIDGVGRASKWLFKHNNGGNQRECNGAGQADLLQVALARTLCQSL